VKAAVCQWFWARGKHFLKDRIKKLFKRWGKCTDVGGNYV
jgi:hypothetical protein